jgi:hypothetical protein
MKKNGGKLEENVKKRCDIVCLYFWKLLKGKGIFFPGRNNLGKKKARVKPGKRRVPLFIFV